jgi:hypothetical protein
VTNVVLDTGTQKEKLNIKGETALELICNTQGMLCHTKKLKNHAMTLWHYVVLCSAGPYFADELEPSLLHLDPDTADAAAYYVFSDVPEHPSIL